MNDEFPLWAKEIIGRLDRIEKQLAQAAHPPAQHLKSSEAMKRLGFKDAKGFHAFVRREAVPHIRLNCRNIVFPRAALLAWEETRSIGRGR